MPLMAMKEKDELGFPLVKKPRLHPTEEELKSFFYAKMIEDLDFTEGIFVTAHPPAIATIRIPRFWDGSVEKAVAFRVGLPWMLFGARLGFIDDKIIFRTSRMGFCGKKPECPPSRDGRRRLSLLRSMLPNVGSNGWVCFGQNFRPRFGVARIEQYMARLWHEFWITPFSKDFLDSFFMVDWHRVTKKAETKAHGKRFLEKPLMQFPRLSNFSRFLDNLESPPL